MDFLCIISFIASKNQWKYWNPKNTTTAVATITIQHIYSEISNKVSTGELNAILQIILDLAFLAFFRFN